LLADLGIDPAIAAKVESAPANLAYTSYLLATVGFGSYAEGISAVLPCYWIYWEVGKELLRPPAERERIHRHFRTTSRYEWMFWDMGYRMESWPV
jgi:thiaminase/transcriptional activator TenA